MSAGGLSARLGASFTVALYIAQQTHLLALGDPKRAAEMLAEAERAAEAPPAA